MFPDEGDLEHLIINETQRIILVGFAIEPRLERMIEWLSEGYGVGINAVSLKYIRTSSGDEVLIRTSIINKHTEEARVRTKKFTIPMSDVPGEYDVVQLRELIFDYLSQSLVTVQRIREVLLPSCLEQDYITRDELKQRLIKQNVDIDPRALSSISGQIGMQRNDFLRQAIGYGYPNNKWEKDNYYIHEEYRELVTEILQNLKG